MVTWSAIGFVAIYHYLLFMLRLLTLTAWLLIGSRAATSQGIPLIIEAESGRAGHDFLTRQEGDITFVTTSSNGASQSPESAARLLTYSLTFPAAGSYDLYVRLRVGAGAFSDDSFFVGQGFGEKQPTLDSDWILVNQLATGGFSGPDEVITGAGTAGSSSWKWVRISDFAGAELPYRFTVAATRTLTWQIGSREDGLEIDKFAFGSADYSYTVGQLDRAEAGIPHQPMNPDPAPGPIAAGKRKFLGNIYSTSQLPGFADYWNQVTPENAGKWGSVEAVRDQMNWAPLDAAYRLAKDNGFYFKFHVLVWGNQQPAWIERLPPAEQRAEIEEWFRLVAERYPDIDAIEVVNEPLHDPPSKAGEGGGNYINALGGTGTTGYDWILQAFRLARKYFPASQLMINEYNIVNNAQNTGNYLSIIKLLQTENLIDQIGVQAHAFSLNASASTINNNLNTLAGSGLPLFVTELDIDGPTDYAQLQTYQRVFPVLWEHPAIGGITLWGYRPGMWRSEQKAYLIEADGRTERPALRWLRAYVNGNFIAATSIRLSTASGDSTIAIKGGRLQLLAHLEPDSVTIDDIFWSVDDSRIATIDDAGWLTARKDGQVRVIGRTSDGSELKAELTIVIKNQESTTTSGEPANALGVEIYPNPAGQGRLYLRQAEQIRSLRILDLTGREIHSFHFRSQPGHDLPLHLPAGCYLLEISDGSRRDIRRLLVQ